MSYQVLARNIVPKFSDVIGQEHVTRTLQNAIDRAASPRLHLQRPPWNRKNDGSRILAMALNCRSTDKPSAEPCGCASPAPKSAPATQSTSSKLTLHQSRHRRNSRTARRCTLPPSARPLQDLHPRRATRSPTPSMRCSKLWKSRPATSFHDGDHAARRYSANHSLALPAFQLSRGEV